MPLDRRTFVLRSLRFSVAAGAGTLLACGPDNDPSTDASHDASDDTSPDVADTSGDTDVSADTGDTDAALDTESDVGDTSSDADADTSGDADADVADVAEPSPLPITKGPWMLVVGPQAVMLRVELNEDTPFDLFVRPVGGDWQTVSGTAREDALTFEWPPGGLQVEMPDVPGQYWLHEITFTDLAPGQRYEWEIRVGDRVETDGHFMAPPAKGTPFRLVWISDTMHPFSEDSAEVVRAAEPDLIIHGGDLQYQSNPLDTWNGFFANFADVMRKAPYHAIVGNHEYEGFNEYEVLFVRLFSGQGDETRGEDYHGFTWGGVRFICLSSEEDFTDNDGPQGQWLMAELEAAAVNDDVQTTIAAFHRPFWTFSRSAPNMSARAAKHPLFVDAGVRLVMTGHNHCYERFEVDGVVYVVDGGGGAFNYNADHRLDEVTAERPEELPLRKASATTYGASILDFDADGNIDVERYDTNGVLTDSFRIEVDPGE